VCERTRSAIADDLNPLAWRAKLKKVTIRHLVVVAFSTLACSCQSSFVAHPLGSSKDRNEPPASVIARQEAIREELKALEGHPWAGEYYQGDGLGVNISLSLAPREGVSATSYGCLGLYGSNEGRVVVLPDGDLTFAFNLPNKSGFGGFPKELVPVRWGERHYLLQRSEMFDFVNAVNANVEPSAFVMGNAFLLKKGDEGKKVAGLPDLPKPYLTALRAEPVEAAVTEVTTLADRKNEFACFKNYQVALDRGETSGLLVGMKLNVLTPRHVFEKAEIITLNRDNGVAELRIMEEECDHPKSVPTTGWKLTTGAYDPAVYEYNKDLMGRGKE
jgi:hypothetical protein